MRVAEALKALRESIQLARTDAVALSNSDLSVDMLELWECGDEVPDLLSLNAYLEVLGFDFHDLQNALEGIDVSPEAVPSDWLEELLGPPSDEPESRKALAKTLERLEKMYEGQPIPDEVDWLKAKLRAELGPGSTLDRD